jgi:hypothetical protein
MQSLSRDDAKALVLEWCSNDPQPEELYLVWPTGNKYRYPEIWVMSRNTTYHRYVFEIHKSASMVEHPTGVEIVQRLRSGQTMITDNSWKALLKDRLAVYKGPRIRK